MVKQLDHLNMTVRDLASSLSFYETLFDFEVVERDAAEQWAIIKSGEAMLCLYEFPDVATAAKYPDPPSFQEVRHFALRITDGPAFLARLKERGIRLRYGGPVEWPHSTAYYLDDPSGHQIEVVAWHDDVIRFDKSGVERVSA